MLREFRRMRHLAIFSEMKVRDFFHAVVTSCYAVRRDKLWKTGIPTVLENTALTYIEKEGARGQYMTG